MGVELSLESIYNEELRAAMSRFGMKYFVFIYLINHSFTVLFLAREATLVWVYLYNLIDMPKVFYRCT